MQVGAQFLPTSPQLSPSEALPHWAASPQHRYFGASTQGPRKAQGPLSTFLRHIVIAADFLHCDSQSDLPTSHELGLAHVVYE